MTTPYAPSIVPLIVERDDGGYQIGLHDDAPGPFPNRQFAQAVAEQRIVRDLRDQIEMR
jgi:hypothetical protein